MHNRNAGQHRSRDGPTVNDTFGCDHGGDHVSFDVINNVRRSYDTAFPDRQITARDPRRGLRNDLG